MSMAWPITERGTFHIARENTGAAVDTAIHLTELGGDSPGNPRVPEHVTRLTKVLVNAAPDYGTSEDLGFISALTVAGNGLLMSKQRFLGPGGSSLGSTAWGHHALSEPGVYYVNMPVMPGGILECDGYMHGEDIGDITINCGLTFDGPPGPIMFSDYRETDLATANKKEPIDDYEATAGQLFDLPGYNVIVDVALCFGIKPATGQDVRIGGVFMELSGALQFSGPYEHMCHAGASVETGSAGDAFQIKPTHDRTLIPVKRTGQITASGQMIEDDAGTIFAGINLGYARDTRFK